MDTSGLISLKQDDYCLGLNPELYCQLRNCEISFDVVTEFSKLSKA